MRLYSSTAGSCYHLTEQSLYRNYHLLGWWLGLSEGGGRVDAIIGLISIGVLGYVRMCDRWWICWILGDAREALLGRRDRKRHCYGGFGDEVSIVVGIWLQQPWMTGLVMADEISVFRFSIRRVFISFSLVSKPLISFQPCCFRRDHQLNEWALTLPRVYAQPQHKGSIPGHP